MTLYGKALEKQKACRKLARKKNVRSLVIKAAGGRGRVRQHKFADGTLKALSSGDNVWAWWNGQLFFHAEGSNIKTFHNWRGILSKLEDAATIATIDNSFSC